MKTICDDCGSEMQIARECRKSYEMECWVCGKGEIIYKNDVVIGK